MASAKQHSCLETIKGFVAGEIAPCEFRDRLYQDEEFETLLTDDPNLEASNYAYRYGSAYHFVIAQDFDDPAGVLNAQGALSDFMDRNKIEYSTTKRYGDFYDLLLSAQPPWLAIDTKYIVDHMMPDAGQRSGVELRDWLALEFERRFRYLRHPPVWIQSPDWPIHDNRPLVFLGQLKVNNYFHDRAAVYVFHNPHTGHCESITQVF